MLFKLSLSNIRKSLRDYAIYFFTLIIGVSIFYVFNAIGGQAAMMKVTESRYDIIQLLSTSLSGVSVFVAGVLGLLIVYASRFLIKRRSKEFALYMMLGMGKGRISAILLLETLLIGIGSLLVGLLAGIGLSQLMSALVANLFEADMTAYRFSISGEAIGKTILYFAVMYLVVMLFNSAVVTRMKLIDLLHSDKRSEQVRLKNPLLCIIIFLLSAAALAYAYYQVGWNAGALTQQKALICIAMGCVSTFFVFWSVSGMFLRIIMSVRNVYHKGLNSFTFRQISSKVNTMVFSMTVICLMLFVTICALCSSFSVRNSLNSNLKEFCAADCELNATQIISDENDKIQYICHDAEELFAASGLSLTDSFREYVHFASYVDPAFTLRTVLGDTMEEAMQLAPLLRYDDPREIVSVSDYNAVCKLYGKDTVTLSSDEYILLCNYKNQQNLFNKVLADRPDMTVFGKTLHARYDCCQDGFIDIGAQAMNLGVFIVPDDAVDPACKAIDYVIGNYQADTEEERSAVRTDLKAWCETAQQTWQDAHPGEEIIIAFNTKADIYESAISLGAIVTFLGLYIGLVFLIACGAILSLKELSESVDSIGRYEMLRKIGAEERDLSASLFRQTGLFFLLPLILACIHSVFGLRFASTVLESIGTQQVGASMTATVIIILLIYGGYFLITYFCSRGIVKERK